MNLQLSSQRLAARPLAAGRKAVASSPLITARPTVFVERRVLATASAYAYQTQRQISGDLRRGVALIGRAAEPDSDSTSTGSITSPALTPEEEQDFDLLSDKVAELVETLLVDLKGCSIYLVGMMGSGKSTVGKMLSNTLKYKLFDVDAMVETTHDGKPVAEIFKEFGQDYFRECEAQVLKQLAPYKSLVVSTGGGAVCRPMNWSYMQQGVVVWLQGSPELLARRVAKDGLEKRPLLAPEEGESGDLYSSAHAKITELLAERTKYYENADLVVSLEGSGIDAETGAPTVVVMYRLLKSVKAKIDATSAEREAKRNFKIENADSMRTIQSPVADGAQE